MLILTRRVGETVMIGHNVTVTVLAINGHNVRLQVGAPQDIAVNRAEVVAQRAQKQVEASE